MWGGCRALPRETLLFCVRKGCHRGVENQTEQASRAEAGREQRAADLHVVLMTRGLRNLVTVLRRKPRRPEEEGVKVFRNGEPAIYDGQHTSEMAHVHVGTNSEGLLEDIVISSDGKMQTRDEEQRHQRVALVL